MTIDVRRGGVLLAGSLVLLTLACAVSAAAGAATAQDHYEQRLEQLSGHPLLPAPRRVDTAIMNVNVIPMTQPQVLRDRVVVIRQGRIVSIAAAGSGKVPNDVRIIDGRNGYLMPGLADMHVHSHGNPLSLALYLANGITTIREMSGRLEYLDWARRISAGQALGPRIYTTGPIFGGRRTDKDTVAVADDERAARAEVEKEYAAGYRLLKPYTFLSATAYRSAMQVAKAKGMYVVGHIPYSVGTAGILAAGQDEVAHVHSFHPDYFRDFDPGKVFMNYAIDPTFMDRFIPRLRAAGIAVTTTLIVNQALADSQNVDDYLARPAMSYETPGAAAFMRSAGWMFNKMWPHDYLMSVYLPYLYQLTDALQQAGVPLVLGTDSGTPGVVHGFGAHEELALLVQAGLTPYQALLTATRNAAAVAHDSAQWGDLVVGKQADLLLLRANPLEDIRNTRNIDGVMRAGQWLDRGQLDALLTVTRKAYQ